MTGTQSIFVPKPTKHYLIERHGHLVTKDELLDTVWADVEVTENALTSCIKEARFALGDDVQQPVFLRTIPRLGYEFIAKAEHRRRWRRKK